MCTLIALHQCFAGAPLVVAANRDEYRDRPAEGPALRDVPLGPVGSAGPDAARPLRRILAPRDLRAGGTWLGLNSSGLLAAVTNRRCEQPDPARRSRGWLVLDALEQPTARAAAERLERLPAAAYNPFNLLVADAQTAHLFSYADRAQRFDLAPGAHVIGNVHPKDEASPKLDALRRAVNRVVDSGDPLLDGLADICRGHGDGAPSQAACVHAGAYGTCSSTLLRLGRDPVLRYADGPPCETPYSDLTPLLQHLGLAPGSEGVQA